MARPRLLIVPEFTELQWTIKPLLEEWGEVRSFDPPGVGDEPPAPEPGRQAIVDRGLEELDRAGWSSFFIVADGWGIATGARIAARRSGAVLGLALGHASLSYAREGERAPMRPQVYAAMEQLMRSDAPSFVRYGIVQGTAGSIDERVAERMLRRLPTENMVEGWRIMTADDAIGETVRRLDCPLLFAKHEGCLMSTEEGFDDAVAAFPDAETIAVPRAPCTSEEFAEALRAFCSRVSSR